MADDERGRVLSFPCGHSRMEGYTDQCGQCNATCFTCPVCHPSLCEHCKAKDGQQAP